MSPTRLSMGCEQPPTRPLWGGPCRHPHRTPYKCHCYAESLTPRELPGPALLGVSDSRGRRRLGQIGEGIVGDIFVAYFEVQICTGGAAAGADSGDGLAALHAGAFSDQVHLVVAIDGCVLVVVTDDDDIAVAVQRARKNHRAAIGRVHRGAFRRGDVDSLVHRPVANPEP